MKVAAKIKRLGIRINDWNARGGVNKNSGHVHRCPGSMKK